jgi:hypothetical protein
MRERAKSGIILITPFYEFVEFHPSLPGSCRTQKTDAGRYTCVPSMMDEASVTLHVIDSEFAVSFLKPGLMLSLIVINMSEKFLHSKVCKLS